MTEKVMSLSSGLVLGMAFALCLGVGTTQLATSPMHMDYPSIPDLISLNDLQSFHAAPAPPSSDTTPVITTAPPANTQGRIIRIATVTETVDPVLSQAFSSGTAEPKNWTASEEPKIGGTLQQAHLQHSYIARAGDTSAGVGLIQVARQTNFTSIACGSSGRGTQTADNGTGQPSIIDDKPTAAGSPSITQNGPEENEGEEGGSASGPAVAGFSPEPKDPDDTFSNDNELVDDYLPHHGHDHSDLRNGNPGYHPDPHYGSSMQQGYRPGFD